MADNLFWHYSIGIYAKPEVEPLLLQLQDGFGADINMVLLSFYLASNAQQLSKDDYRLLLNSIAGWQSNTVMPLRAVRRYLKSNPDEAAQALRDKVKILELDAELWQQNKLYAEIKNRPFSQGDSDDDFRYHALHNLQNYIEFLSGVEWEDISAIIIDLIVLIEKK